MVFHVDGLLFMATPLFISMTMSLTLCAIITHYLTNKALGMQTVYDRVLMDLIKIFSLFNVFLTTSIIIGHMFWPVPNFVSIGLVVCYLVTMYIMATTFLVTLCVRYMSVYHSRIIDLVEENQLIRYLRLGVLQTVTLMLIVELSMYNSNNCYHVYNLLKTGSTGKGDDSLQVIKYLIITDLVGAVCLQLRLEYDAVMVYQEKHQRWFKMCSRHFMTFDDTNQSEDGGYSLNTIRLFILLCIVVIVSPILVLQVSGQLDLFYSIFIHFVMFAVIPLLAIVKNDKLKKHGKNMFLSCLWYHDA